MKRNKPLKRTGFKRKTPSKKPKKARKRAKTKKRDKLPKIVTMRNKCDKLLTPIIKEMHPHCLLQGSATCAYETQVAHHHVHKSKSNRLRYEIDNLIPLCHSCHLMLHQNESYWASKVVAIRGIEWFEKIEKMKQETVKCDIHWYIANYERLRAILE